MKMLWLLIGAAALLLASSTAYVVNEGEVGVLFQFGRIVQSNIAPGLHYKIPVAQTALRFDRRLHTFDAEPERYGTQEKKDVLVDYFAKWRIRDVRRYYTATLGSDRSAELRLDPIVREALRNTIKKRGLQDLVSMEREALGGDMLRGVNAASQSLGIEVVDVRISRIDLPEELLDNVYERMRAERTRVANQSRAEGDEESSKIRAEAERQRQVIAADAERDAQVLRGQGDATAAATSAAAYSQDPEFYAFWRSLEAYRKSFASGRDTVVLDRDSELMRYFQDSGRAAPER
jgi:membrane protease subunit HflC